MPKLTITIAYEGSLADSLRAVANLVDDYGKSFTDDASSYYAMHNDGIVNHVDLEEVTDGSIDDALPILDDDVLYLGWKGC